MSQKLAEERMLRPERRKALLEAIRRAYPEKSGAVLLCAAYERDREPFFQDSSFHYFVGIDEPSLIFYQLLSAEPVLYEPCYAIDRSVWLSLKKDAKILQQVGLQKTEYLGNPVPGYSMNLFAERAAFETIIKTLSDLVQKEQSVFTLLSEASVEALVTIRQLCHYVPGLSDRLVDIAPLVARLRRIKHMRELEHMYRAIEITAAAQEGAMEAVEPGVSEAHVQATIDYIFAEGGAVKAFANVVGSGKNSTVLHYVDNDAIMHAGDLVVVDIGASSGHYAADVTRTYPVSGTFTERQKEIYQCVLDAQTYVAELARPGMYLRNPEKPEESLHHIAYNFFKDRGYADYFPHGIGHYVGLDVHDVGDRQEPLKPGDVITIEPGLYFSQEKLGVRIEDMYWIVEDGVVCLTDGIVKEIDDIEEYMQTIQED